MGGKDFGANAETRRLAAFSPRRQLWRREGQMVARHKGQMVARLVAETVAGVSSPGD